MLQNSIVMITGASAGIGEACARLFAREGARLILAARRLPRLEDLAADLRRAHRTHSLLLELDVRDRGAVLAAVGGLPPQWAEVDVLVNNAGLSRGLDKLQEGSHQDWEEMIDTNIKGLLWVTRAVLPGMVERDRGHVINIGSIAGRQVYPAGNVYCATKHAVRALNQGLRLDLLGTRVRCSTVDPGLVQTEFSAVRFRGNKDKAEPVYKSFPPLQAADVAEVVLFCATRPAHVDIQEVVVMPRDQAAVYGSFARGVD